MTPGFKYLKEERHLSDETIRLFHLGYIDKGGELYADSNFPNPSLSIKDSRFNGTAIFPIFNLYGDMIAVSARTIEKREGAPKYINTIYDKANHLYGLHETWKNCLATQTAYVVEGNVDFLMMHQYGITNSVAMLGSNLSIKQIGLLLRFAKKIIFVPDGDTAGQKVLTKVKALLPKNFFDPDFEMTFGCIQLPAGYDPDKFLREKGVEEFKKSEQLLLTGEELRRTYV